jgi:hypothetical protein
VTLLFLAGRVSGEWWQLYSSGVSVASAAQGALAI